jgi:NAD(P)-dependent dehydrogenase (short-subunit alcohol dehydrogenase family)
MIKGKGPSGFGYDSTADQVLAGLDLRGKTYLVTGCNSGLGLESMRALAARGARIVGAARDAAKAAAACASAGGDALPLACELANPVSVRAAVAAVRKLGVPLDGIIANAGIMALPKLQQAYGYELQFFTNHVGHFMLVTGLLAELSDAGRVVMVSSAAHSAAPPGGIQLDNLSGAKGYAPWSAYGQSKLANILFAKHLASRLPKPGQTAHALHPGVIQTNLGRHMPAAMYFAFGLLGRPFLKTIPQGAATECFVATHPLPAKLRGEYFADCNVAAPKPAALDAELARRLWEKTEQIVAGLR